MSRLSVPSAIRAKIGDEGAEGLVEMFTAAQATSDLRLTQEICGLRVEMHRELGAIRHEIASSRVEILKWMIALWVANLSGTIGVIALLLRH